MAAFQLTLTRKLTIAELQRLKRQFLKLSSLHQVCIYTLCSICPVAALVGALPLLPCTAYAAARSRCIRRILNRQHVARAMCLIISLFLLGDYSKGSRKCSTSWGSAAIGEDGAIGDDDDDAANDEPKRRAYVM